MTKLGDLLGLARELKGLTLRELEDASGVSNALISQIETGKVKDPGFSTVIALADALGLSLERVAAAGRKFRDLGVLRKAALSTTDGADSATGKGQDTKTRSAHER